DEGLRRLIDEVMKRHGIGGSGGGPELSPELMEALKKQIPNLGNGRLPQPGPDFSPDPKQNVDRPPPHHGEGGMRPWQAPQPPVPPPPSWPPPGEGNPPEKPVGDKLMDWFKDNAERFQDMEGLANPPALRNALGQLQEITAGHGPNPSGLNGISGKL